MHYGFRGLAALSAADDAWAENQQSGEKAATSEKAAEASSREADAERHEEKLQERSWQLGHRPNIFRQAGRTGGALRRDGRTQNQGTYAHANLWHLRDQDVSEVLAGRAEQGVVSRSKEALASMESERSAALNQAIMHMQPTKRQCRGCCFQRGCGGIQGGG